MILYAESSAVLAWLLGEPAQHVVLSALQSSERVVTCALTAVECARGIRRGLTTKRFTRRDELAALHLLDSAMASWDVLDLTDDVMTRARDPFPLEPVRTIDALHIAAALTLREALGPVTILSFDARVRENALLMHFPVVPDVR